ncbi:lytic transglycosylase domain-containing protein [Brytella acorum]|uniref:lytic transglycosylase domain-containing protein n=1 Tax=Brytella acorum TaxID=2959299 RepID=UPI0025AE639E|nr:lytic transglycosylase domain-containing protein [Brytella acorum]MDF3623918.1 lytic transglycosylase domain-containing protein [Brytella acorum]
MSPADPCLPGPAGPGTIRRRGLRSGLNIGIGATLLLTACAGHADPLVTPTDRSSISTTYAQAVQTTAALDVSPAIRARVETWLNLIGPNATATLQDYADFLRQKPTWPLRGLMMARYQRLLTGADDTTLSSFCPSFPLTSATTLIRCATFLHDAPAQARALWLHGGVGSTEENAFLAAFGNSFTADDHWTRFEALEKLSQYARARQLVARLSPDRQALASARIAFHLSLPGADSTLAALSAQDQADPDLTLARLHSLRRADRLGDALALWKQPGFGIQTAHPTAAWTQERMALARTLLLAGSPQDAILLAQDETMPPASTARLEAQFLTGWIRLRYLHDPAGAIPQFTDLLQDRSLITSARGAYWLGRAHEALHQDMPALQAYQRAAAMPTTFYGQMALSALHDHGPTLTPDSIAVPGLAEALSALPRFPAGPLPRPDLAQAAQVLTGMGDNEHARQFLMMLYAAAQEPRDQAALANFSLSLGNFEPAVFAARGAGKKGIALYPQGWPVLPELRHMPDDGLPPGLALAVARQESSFDPRAVSGARAIGLMQFQTGTAHDVARRAGLSIDTSAAALTDPQINMTLGRAYLKQLLERYNNAIPEALAAYNAGPHRTDLWLAADPPPTTWTQDGMIDWIERLPYEETRSYIQRIEESMPIYRLLEEQQNAG